MATNRWNCGLTEGEKEFVFFAELPGFEEKELNISLYENLLTVTAERKEEEACGKNYCIFRRSVAVPAGTDPNKIKATYRNGVLELHIPKVEGMKAKHIPIKVE
jgi:HSP20 family protein